MTLRLDDLILRGEISHHRRNSIAGWIELDTSSMVGDPDKIPEYRFVHLEFAGNLRDELAGRRFRFEIQQRVPPEEPIVMPDDFQDRQIGVISKASWREDAESSVPKLIMEWFGQNGPISLQIVEPVVEFEGEYKRLVDPFPPEEDDLNEDSIEVDEVDRMMLGDSLMTNDGSLNSFLPFRKPLPDVDDNDSDDIDDESLDDAFLEDEAAGMFEDFEGDMDDGPLDIDFEDEEDALEGYDRHRAIDDQNIDPDNPNALRQPPNLRPWDEVIPGIDPATKALYEQWDEVTYGTVDEPLTWLFDGAFKLPRPDLIDSEEEAEDALRTLLAQLAKCGVAFDMCEHFTSKDAYRLLIEEILPDAEVHPRLVSTGFVMHYSTFEHCPKCDEEFNE